MALPVVTVASGGLPVSTAANGLGLPIEEAVNGLGCAVTFVGSGGLPVVRGAPLPLDAVSGVTVLAAGSYTKSLTRSWLNGNLFDVVVGGVTTTIKAAAGSIDIPSLAAALGGGAGYISKRYDQSGAGRDYTQAAADNRPAVFMSGGRPIFVQDGFTQKQYSGVPKFLRIPASVVFDARSGTHFFVHKMASSVPGDSVNGFEFSTLLSTTGVGVPGFSFLMSFLNGTGNANQNYIIDNTSFAVGAAGFYPETQKLVSSYKLTPTFSALRQNENLATGPALAAGTANGGYLGILGGLSETDPTNAYYGQMEADLLFGSILTDAQETAVRQSLYALFNIYQAPAASVHFDGSSIEQGYGAIPDPATDGVWGAGYGYVDQVIDALNAPIRFGNSGLAGFSFFNLNAGYAADVHPFFAQAPAGKKIIVAGGFSAHNSFAAYAAANPGWTPAQLASATFADLQTYITTVKADAWDKVFVFTDFEGATFFGNFQAAAVLYNASVIAGAAAMGVTVIDIGQGTPLTANWGGGTPYYNTPTDVHPSIIGAAIIEALTSAALRPSLGLR